MQVQALLDDDSCRIWAQDSWTLLAPCSRKHAKVGIPQHDSFLIYYMMGLAGTSQTCEDILHTSSELSFVDRGQGARD